jgi:hypothetical protein
MDDALNPFAHEWHNQTTIHPLGLTAVVVLGMAMLLVPRRYSVWPMILLACFIPSAQRVVVGPLDFNLLRILLLFGTVRVFFRNEWQQLRWMGLDTAVLLLAAGHVVMGALRVGPDFVINRLGFAYDLVGMYLLFRCLVRDRDDVRSAVLCFTLVAFPVAAAFLVEWTTQRNIFAVFGGVNEITMVRQDRLRCQGAYSHPILAGLFWASLLPLIAAQFWDGGRKRVLAFGAIAAALFIIFACGSSSPVTAVLFGVVGGAAFFVRYWMRWVRWGVLALLVALHLSMQAPVWHLIARIDVVGGSSGYHRFALIDGAIKHFHEWWLVGTKVGTAHWGPDTYDVTNTYVVQGILGGVWLLGLFLLVIVLAFRNAGRIWKSVANDRRELIWSWAIGVALFVHATNFLAITYFGQIDMLWYLQLAMIGSLAQASYAAAAPRTAAHQPAPLAWQPARRSA